MKEGKLQGIVIGSGIQALITAWEMVQNGIETEIYTASDDFRLQSPKSSDPSSATMGGESGRFITLFEGHPYIKNSPMYPSIQDAFEHPVSDGGWLGKTTGLKDEDEIWLNKRKKFCKGFVDAEVVSTFDWYVKTSGAAMTRWRALFRSNSSLFSETSLHTDEILRLYDSSGILKAAESSHLEGAVLREVLRPDEVSKKFPIFRNACDSGAIAGALKVEGYTLNIKKFCRNLLNAFIEQGGKVSFNAQCDSILLNEQSQVTGIMVNGEKKEAYYYGFFPGAYDKVSLLASLQIHVNGVAGRWLVMPRPPNFEIPVKSHSAPSTRDDHTRRPVVDLNFTPYRDEKSGEDMIAVGGGYIHCGSFPFSYDEEEMHYLDEDLYETTKRIIPDAFLEYERAGRITRSKSTCYRAFTPDDKPGFAFIETAREAGCFVVHTGLNTGTTSLAPEIAHRVVQHFREPSKDTVVRLCGMSSAHSSNGAYVFR